MRRGTVVYHRNDCGDHYQGKSVVIPKGIKATYLGVFEHPPQGGHSVGKRAWFDIPDSPGQKQLCCMPDQIDVFWSLTPPPPDPPKPSHQLNVWERLRHNPYAGA